jgi:hypothetical protein
LWFQNHSRMANAICVSETNNSTIDQVVRFFFVPKHQHTGYPYSKFSKFSNFLHVINLHVKVPNIFIYQLGWGLFFKGQYTHAMNMVGFANTHLENHLIYHLGRFFTGFCYGFHAFFGLVNLKCAHLWTNLDGISMEATRKWKQRSQFAYNLLVALKE